MTRRNDRMRHLASAEQQASETAPVRAANARAALTLPRMRHRMSPVRAPRLIKSETHPYRGYVIETESVPVDSRWTFAATVTRNGRVVKSVAASGQVLFRTPEHAADVAVFLSRAWVDRAGRAEPEAAVAPASTPNS